MWMSLHGFCHQYNHKDAGSINNITIYTAHYRQHYNVCPLVVTSSGGKKKKKNLSPCELFIKHIVFLRIPIVTSIT